MKYFAAVVDVQLPMQRKGIKMEDVVVLVEAGVRVLWVGVEEGVEAEYSYFHQQVLLLRLRQLQDCGVKMLQQLDDELLQLALN